MKISIENVYSGFYDDEKELKDEVVLDVNETLSIGDLPEWLAKIGEDYEPKLLEKLNTFANLIKDKVLDPHDFYTFGINYCYDDYGSYTLFFSKGI